MNRVTCDIHEMAGPGKAPQPRGTLTFPFMPPMGSGIRIGDANYRICAFSLVAPEIDPDGEAQDVVAVLIVEPLVQTTLVRATPGALDQLQIGPRPGG